MSVGRASSRSAGTSGSRNHAVARASSPRKGSILAASPGQRLARSAVPLGFLPAVVTLPPEAGELRQRGGGDRDDAHQEPDDEERQEPEPPARAVEPDRKSTRLNSSHGYISYAVF